MAKLISKKCRLCRASEIKLFLKGERCSSNKCPITKKGPILPGDKHVSKRRKKLSDYGIRMREAQKLKRIYGISETRLKGYFKEARKVKGSTGETLFQILESRLDNVIFKSGFAPSRRYAKQLVGHGHILVDGKEVNIPSFQVKAGQILSLDGKAMEMVLVKKRLQDKDFVIPVWMEKKAGVIKFTRMPKKEEIEINVDEQLIVEFYSRR